MISYQRQDCPIWRAVSNYSRIAISITPNHHRIQIFQIGGWRFWDELWVFLNHACFFVVIERGRKVLARVLVRNLPVIEIRRKSKANKVTKNKQV
jgi:apolipoprotein N-acyltransferase